MLVTLNHVKDVSTIPRLMPDIKEEARVLVTHADV